MYTWFDTRFLLPFPLTWFLLFFLPGAAPIIEWGGPLGGGELDLTLLGYPREWLMNNVVLPVLPYDWAVSLADWWMNNGYAGELALHALVSLHLFIPIAFLMFCLFEAYMRFCNWWSRGQFKAETAKAKRA